MPLYKQEPYIDINGNIHVPGKSDKEKEALDRMRSMTEEYKPTQEHLKKLIKNKVEEDDGH